MPIQCNKWKALGEVFETRAESAQLLVSTGPHWNIDADSARKIERTHLKTSKYLHQLSNEPSVGLFHVHEHIKKTVPKAIAMKNELNNTHKKVETVKYDVEDSQKIISALVSINSFRNIQETSKKSTQILTKLCEELES